MIVKLYQMIVMHKSYTIFFLILMALISPPAKSGTTGEDFIRTGESFILRMDYDQAIYYFSRAIEDDPNSVDALLHRAKAYILKDRYEVAMDDYRKALEMDPLYVMEWFRKGKRGFGISPEPDLNEPEGSESTGSIN